MSNGTYDLKWGQDLAGRITPQIKSEVGKIRMDPPVIPIVPGKSTYEDVVQSFKVTPGPPISIKPSTKLAPVKISLEFLLAQQQFADEVLAARLALRPASDLAFAEDAILLHGSRAAELFKKLGLGIKDENNTLGEQDGLFQADPKEIDPKKSIEESVLEGIKELRAKHQHGPYCVVVSPDLHKEAMTPLGDSGIPRINPILPQLRENGFRFSEAATRRTGVIFSLGGAAVDLPVLWDAHLECRTVEGDATFGVTCFHVDPETDINSFDVEGSLTRAAGTAFPHEVLSVLPWKRRELVASSYGRDRVFIAGDAAHQMSPTGGLGMNTGIGDAVDLGWKLAAVLQGWGGPHLLESYEIERKPVAFSSVTASSETYLHETSLPAHPAIAEGEAARRQFAEALRGRRGQGNERLHDGVKLGYSYDGSPIIWPDQVKAPLIKGGDFIPSCRSGARAPHAWSGEGFSTLDLFGDGFVLLRFDPGTNVSSIIAAAAVRQVSFKVVDIDKPEIAALYDRKLVLVRPDGHVAWRADACPNDAFALMDRVRGAGSL